MCFLQLLTSKMIFSIWIKAASYPGEYITIFAKGVDSRRVQMYGIYSWGDNNGKYVTASGSRWSKKRLFPVSNPAIASIIPWREKGPRT